MSPGTKRVLLALAPAALLASFLAGVIVGPPVPPEITNSARAVQACTHAPLRTIAVGARPPVAVRVAESPGSGLACVRLQFVGSHVPGMIVDRPFHCAQGFRLISTITLDRARYADAYPRHAAAALQEDGTLVLAVQANEPCQTRSGQIVNLTF